MSLEGIENLVHKRKSEFEAATELQIATFKLEFEKEKKKNLEFSSNFKMLKADFKYNLKLLQERDEELAAVEASYKKLKIVENKLMQEVDSLTTKVNQINQNLENEKADKKEIQLVLTNQINQLKATFVIQKAEKVKKIDELTSKLETIKRVKNLEVCNLQNEINNQRTELICSFEDEIRCMENKVSEIKEECELKVLKLEMSCKQLSAEKKLLQDKLLKSQNHVKQVLENHSQLKEEFEQLEWDLKDTTVVSSQRIDELIKELDETKEKLYNKDVVMLEYKKQVDGDFRGKQANLEANEKALKKRNQVLELKNNKLKNLVETSELETKKSIWKHNEERKVLQLNIETLKTKTNKNILELNEKNKVMSTKILTQEAEILNLKQQNDILKIDKTKQKDEIQIIKNELIDCRLELDKQKLSSETNGFCETDKFTDESQKNMQKQNNQLKQVIKQMTSQMNNLVPQQVSENSSFVTDLKNKVEDLKKIIKALELEKENRLVDSNNPHEVLISKNHPSLKNYIDTLNKRTIEMESEKIDLSSKLHKLQSNFDHQKVINLKNEQEINRLQCKFQKVELEATNMKHRHQQVIQRKDKEINELNIKLMESHKEADELYKGAVVQSLRELDLKQSISELQVNQAISPQQPQWILNNQQAKLVHDLRNQINILQNKLNNVQKPSFSSVDDSGELKTVSFFKHKLKAATKQINDLQQTNKLLLESSNRFRSQLSKLQQQKTDGDLKNLEANVNIEKLKQLQYDLTKNELEFAKRKAELENSNHEKPQENLIHDVHKHPSKEKAVKEKIIISKPPKKNKKKKKVRNYNEKDDNIFQNYFK